MTQSDPRALAATRVGETLNGKWYIERVLDMGGMAAVYVAVHRNGRRVAVKMLLPQFASHPSVRERFLREGYAANRVDHPNAVAVLDDDVTPDGAVFLVMELLEGESFETWIQRAGGRLPSADVLAVADQVLDVLAAAHPKGIVHRDIKPGNVFITTAGTVKVLDFGLAKVRDGSAGVAATANGVVLGTPSYLSPEQAQGKVALVDGRSDLFAMGALMFRALSGRTVHDYPSSAEKLIAAMKARAPALQSVAPYVPACVCEIVDRAVTFEKEGRYADAAEMQQAVRVGYARLKEWANTVTLPEAPAEGIPHQAEASSIVVDVSFGGIEKIG